MMSNGICFSSNIIMLNDALFFTVTFRHISPSLETCVRYRKWIFFPK